MGKSVRFHNFEDFIGENQRIIPRGRIKSIKKRETHAKCVRVDRSVISTREVARESNLSLKIVLR